MAKKNKKTASKPKKKRSSGKRKSNSLINRVIVIIFVLILAFFLVFSLYKHVGNRKVSEKPEPQLVEKQVKQKEVKSEAKTEAKTNAKANAKASEPTAKEEKKIQQKKSETAAVQKSIQGTWQSTTGGAFLTMDKNGYRLDFMGVDGDAPIIGTYTVDGDIITFINKEDPCKNVKGLYEVKFNKNEIGFKLKSDDCIKRKATLPTEWEWLNTEE